MAKSGEQQDVPMGVARGRRTTCDRDGRPVIQEKGMPMQAVDDVSESRLQHLDGREMHEVRPHAGSESAAVPEKVTAPPKYSAPRLLIAGERRPGQAATESPAIKSGDGRNAGDAVPRFGNRRLRRVGGFEQRR